MGPANFNPGHAVEHATFGAILLERATDDHPGLRFEDQTWTWREFVAEAAVRAEILRVWSREYAASFADRPAAYRRLHVGILLENVPEYLFLLCGAAMAGVTIIGINPTRRGAELASDIRGVDCDVIFTTTTAPRSSPTWTQAPPRAWVRVRRGGRPYSPSTRGPSHACPRPPGTRTRCWRCCSPRARRARLRRSCARPGGSRCSAR
ncbi:AMP-binding protein [Dietzia aerolata]|uniref:AMP-binding protein n=1 Tax=Dietzia aerolata TaxID=595984 RepID=UPI00362F243D